MDATVASFPRNNRKIGCFGATFETPCLLQVDMMLPIAIAQRFFQRSPQVIPTSLATARLLINQNFGFWLWTTPLEQVLHRVLRQLHQEGGSTMKRRSFFALILGILLSTGIGACTQNPDRVASQQPARSSLLIAAASSLKDALQDIEPLYRQAHPGVTLHFNFASSGALQQQIEQGAPADVFFSAAEKQMNALQQKKLILEDTRRVVLSNQLALVTPVQESSVKNLQDLKTAAVKRIAVGEPRSVPVGQYAAETFQQENLTSALRPKLVLASNVRQVLQFVESGNAQAGIVYLTDAKPAKQVKITQTIPNTLHAPIVYPVAVVKHSKNPDAAQKFTQFLSSPAANQIFVEKYGFQNP
jgi:molybdate transport system substrate-binding protein